MRKLLILLIVSFLFFSCTKKDKTPAPPPPPPKSSEKQILSFSFNNLIPAVTATIDQSAKTITAAVPHGTSRTTLSPSITLSSLASVSPATGIAQNFTVPVVYTVTAEDGSNQQYTVTISEGRSSQKQIISFVLEGITPIVTCNINQTTRQITAMLPSGTNLTNLTPTITVSASANCNPASGVAQNFTNPVTYRVTAQDGSTQDYTVDLNIASKYINIVKVVNSWLAYDANTWERQHPVYENNNMQIFMVCIWNIASPKVSLYKFPANFDPLQPAYIMGGAAWVAYRESFNILNVPILATTSSNYLQAFKQVFDKIINDYPAQHYGIKYSGHGVATGGLFEEKISTADTRDLLAYINGLINAKIDFLDWNTNCNGAAYRVVSNQFNYAKYILASDILRGGYNFDVNEFFDWHHEQKMHTFFSPSKTIRQSLIDMINSERNFWASPNTRGHMTTGLVMQSISIFDTDKFQLLASSTNMGVSGFVGDALNYIRTNFPSQEPAFNEFRFHYISNKDFFAWPVNTNGFHLN